MQLIEWLTNLETNFEAEMQTAKANGEASRSVLFQGELMGSARQCAATAAGFNQREEV